MQKKRSVLIVTGGATARADVPCLLSPFDYVIAADSGYDRALALGIRPDLLVGDFDSAKTAPDGTIPVLRVPAEKNETDTMLAAAKAVDLGAETIQFLGGLGGRTDHELSNLFLLESLCLRGVRTVLTDGENRIRAVKDETVTLPHGAFRYFSLLSLGQTHATVRGAKYPLEDAPIDRTLPYAVSNEWAAEEAKVTVCGDCAFLIESERI